MASPLVLKALDLGDRLGQTMLPLIVRWDVNRHRMRYRREGTKLTRLQKLWFIEAFTLFGVLGVGTFLVDILFLLKSPPDHPLYLELTRSANLISTRFIMSNIFFGGCIFTFGVYRWGDDIGSYANELWDFDEAVTRDLPKKDPKRLDILGLCMMASVLTSVVAPPIPAIVTVYRGQDSYYTFLRLILPSQLFQNRMFRLATATIRIVILSVTGYEIGRIMILLLCAILLLCISLVRSSKMVQEFYKTLDNNKKLQARGYVRRYHEFFLIMRAGNIVGSASLSAGHVVSQSLFIAFAIILIKLRDSQPLPILVISGMFMLGIFVVLGFILPVMVSLYENCVTMLYSWRNDPCVRGNNRRYLKAKLRSLQPYCLFIGFELHKLQVIDREFAVETLYSIASRTVDVLLALD